MYTCEAPITAKRRMDGYRNVPEERSILSVLMEVDYLVEISED